MNMHLKLNIIKKKFNTIFNFPSLVAKNKLPLLNNTINCINFTILIV